MIEEALPYSLWCIASPIMSGKCIVLSFLVHGESSDTAVEYFSNVFLKILCLELCLSFRHRAVNLFLQGYEKSWIETEEHYFEDKLIEDLAVCFNGVIRWKRVGFGGLTLVWALIISKRKYHCSAFILGNVFLSLHSASRENFILLSRRCLQHHAIQKLSWMVEVYY